MRKLIVLLTVFAGSASAHTLGADEELASQLWHELLGLHHLPLTLLLVLVGLLAYRSIHARRKS